MDPWVRKIPWRTKWQPAPVFLPGKSHGQRNLVGYSPWGCKELDKTEHTHTHTSLLAYWLLKYEIYCDLFILDLYQSTHLSQCQNVAVV